MCARSQYDGTLVDMQRASLISTLSPGARYDCDRLVEDLAVPHRETEALRALMSAGRAATPAVRRGLRHDDPVVRVGCCKVLDHFMDEAALPELIDNLRHPDPRVRLWAVHALACDRCKEGACRPGENDVIPLAVDLLLHDSNRHVRQMVAGLLGPAVHRSADVLDALLQARDHDAHPAVRKVARWYTPGGSRYRRLMPKAPRVAR
jgi:HEAT repeat protein